MMLLRFLGMLVPGFSFTPCPCLFGLAKWHFPSCLFIQRCGCAGHRSGLPSRFLVWVEGLYLVVHVYWHPFVKELSACCSLSLLRYSSGPRALTPESRCLYFQINRSLTVWWGNFEIPSHGRVWASDPRPPLQTSHWKLQQNWSGFLRSVFQRSSSLICWAVDSPYWKKTTDPLTAVFCRLRFKQVWSETAVQARADVTNWHGSVAVNDTSYLRNSVQSWSKISVPLHFCQIMHHFSQKNVAITNVLVFTCLFILFALEKHKK